MMETADAVSTGQYKRPRGGGRPTRAQAVLRDARLLEIATTMFEARGFDATSMDAIAEDAGVSKATVYARYEGKAALFRAVLSARIDRYLTPLAEEARQVVEGNEPDVLLDAVLTKIGARILRSSLAAEAVGMQRILLANAVKFPELARLSHEEGWCRTVALLASVLRSYSDRGGPLVTDPEMAADMFLNMVVGREQRSVMLGYEPLDEAAIERRARRATEILLYGVSSHGMGRPMA